MQFYEPEHGSGEVCNIKEYGFAFIETDAENAVGSEISQGKQQRQISRIELNEEKIELRPEIDSFMKKTGFELPTETMVNMFIKGMDIKDDE